MPNHAPSPKGRNRPAKVEQSSMVPRYPGTGAVPILNLQRPSRSVGPELYRAVLVCRSDHRDQADAF